MRLHLFAAMLAAILATSCMTGSEPTRESAQLSPALAKELAGRTPGPPTSCIRLHEIRSSRIVDETAIIYETSAQRWYVNRPPGGCPGLNPSRTLVTRTSTNSLCSGDIVRIIDPPGPIEYGSCGLGQFVPYTK